MFRELLESNGIKVEWFGGCVHGGHVFDCELITQAISVNDEEFYFIGTKEKALEQACMEYCIENNIKRNHLHKIGIDIKDNGITYLVNMKMNKEDANRLWYLILGHDIKIIA